MSARAGWTPETKARYEATQARLEAKGTCPFLGASIAHCWRSGLCDCSMTAPTECHTCGVSVWDIDAHRHTRMHHKH